MRPLLAALLVAWVPFMVQAALLDTSFRQEAGTATTAYKTVQFVNCQESPATESPTNGEVCAAGDHTQYVNATRVSLAKFYAREEQGACDFKVWSCTGIPDPNDPNPSTHATAPADAASGLGLVHQCVDLTVAVLGTPDPNDPSTHFNGDSASGVSFFSVDGINLGYVSVEVNSIGTDPNDLFPSDPNTPCEGSVRGVFGTLE